MKSIYFFYRHKGIEYASQWMGVVCSLNFLSNMSERKILKLLDICGDSFHPKCKKFSYLVSLLIDIPTGTCTSKINSFDTVGNTSGVRKAALKFIYSKCPNIILRKKWEF